MPRVWVIPVMTAAILVAQAPRERLPGWNASFAVPSGWKVAGVSGRAVALTDSTDSGALFITAAYLTNAADAQAELDALFADLHYAPTVTAAPADTVIGAHRAIVASYSGAGRDGPIVSRAAIVFSDYGTGITVLGLARAARQTAVVTAVAQLAASVQADMPATNVALVAALRGHWDYAPPPAAAQDSTAAGTATVHEWLEFDGRDRFTQQSRTIVAIRGGNPITAESDDDTGTYTAVGNTLILRGKGKPRAIDARLAGDTLSLGGRAYRRQRP